MFVEAVSDVLLKSLPGNLSDCTEGFGVCLDPLGLTDVSDCSFKSVGKGHVRFYQDCLFRGVMWDSYLQM